jgi:DNA-binding NarL/FixJ family response regulator
MCERRSAGQNPSRMQQTILIVDDHSAFRSRARRLLEAEGYAIVGEAEDGATALAAALELAPDLVLLDVCLPDTTGFAVARQLAGNRRAPAIVLTSTHDETDFGELARRSDALGFLPKAELSGAALQALLADR